jgi:hypothetical protein
MRRSRTLLGIERLTSFLNARGRQQTVKRSHRFEPTPAIRDQEHTNTAGLQMMTFEIIAAIMITLSLAAMLNQDTRDTRIRVVSRQRSIRR